MKIEEMQIDSAGEIGCNQEWKWTVMSFQFCLSWLLLAVNALLYILEKWECHASPWLSLLSFWQLELRNLGMLRTLLHGFTHDTSYPYCIFWKIGMGLVKGGFEQVNLEL